MKFRPHTIPPIHWQRRDFLTLLSAELLTSLAGCGAGSGSLAGLSTGGTGSFSTGTISGLGSIIVNGVRYDNTGITPVSMDDGTVINTNLQVGMVVTVEGSAITAATGTNALPTATASKIRLGSEWMGPISGINTVQSVFMVLGNTVEVLSTTVFAGGANQLADLTGYAYAEIYGYIDNTTNHLQATLVVASNTTPTAYKISGVVSNLSHNISFQIGNVVIDYSATSPSTGTWSTGSRVKVWLNTTPQGSAWVANKILAIGSPDSDLPSDQHPAASLRGKVTSLVSGSTGIFYVEQVKVNASGVANLPSISVGNTVDVQGTWSSGVLIATAVTIKTTALLVNEKNEFFGVVSNLNLTASSFTLKGINFIYDNSTVFNGFTWASYQNQIVYLQASHNNGIWKAISLGLSND